MNNKKVPMVSVCMITYNHEKYISQALEGVLQQLTNFKFEIIIGEDCSTDKTRAIIKSYQRTHPTIKLLQNDTNIGMMPNFINTLKACRGKYIALCEGDDYWADRLKLQKQVDLLEENNEYIVSYHNAKIIDEAGNIIQDSKLPKRLQKDFNENELQKGSLILTLTMCFRNIIKDFPEEMFHVKNGDTFLISLLGNYGKGKYLSDIKPACYRVHSGGVWSGSKEIEKYIKQAVTFYYLYCYHLKIGQKAISNFYKEKFKSRYTTVAIVYFKSKKYKKSFTYLLKRFKTSR